MGRPARFPGGPCLLSGLRTRRRSVPCPNPSGGGPPVASDAALDALLGIAEAVRRGSARPGRAAIRNRTNEFFARLHPPCAETSGVLVHSRRAPDSH